MIIILKTVTLLHFKKQTVFKDTLADSIILLNLPCAINFLLEPHQNWLFLLSKEIEIHIWIRVQSHCQYWTGDSEKFPVLSYTSSLLGRDEYSLLPSASEHRTRALNDLKMLLHSPHKIFVDIFLLVKKSI